LWLFTNPKIPESRTFASEIISSNLARPISLDLKKWESEKW